MKRGVFGGFVLFVLVVVLGSIAYGTSFPRVAFVRNMEIWLTDLAGSQPVYLVDGFDPELSPDGSMLAFTDYREGRKIAVLDIDSRKLRVLDTIPGDNHYGPRWSPDGERLVFNYWKEMEDYKSYWVIAIIHPDGNELTLLTEEYEDALYSPFWAQDGRSVYAQDLQTMYQFDLTGNLIGTQDLSEIVEIGISSATFFSFSGDGKRLLYDRLVDEPTDLWGTPWMHEPATAVFIFYVHEGIIERVSPAGTSFINPAWVPGEDAVLVFGFTEEDLPEDVNMEVPFRIYRLSIEDRAYTVLIENGMFPTCARE